MTGDEDGQPRSDGSRTHGADEDGQPSVRGADDSRPGGRPPNNEGCNGEPKGGSSEDASRDNWPELDRRKLLTALAGAITAVTGGVYLSSREPAPSDLDFDRIDTGYRVPEDAQNIAEYGAKPNPNDPDAAAAERNLEAIVDAATAAGEGGSIYVPEGTYYFGHDGSGPERYLDFGEKEPAGVSIYGADPETATLAVTGRAPASEQPIQSGFRWSDGYDHGRVDVRNVRLDGNYENLDNLRAVGGGSWGIQVDGEGELHLFNAHIRGWHLAGVRGREFVRSAHFCTFEDNGIGNHNDTDGGSISHHLTCRPPDDATLVVSRCRFVDCAGSAVNIRFNDGVVRIHDCHVSGTGANLLKLSAGRLVELRRVYHEATTESLKGKLVDREGGKNFYGKNFIQSLGERGRVPVTVHMEHVESRNIREYAFQSRDNYEQGPADLTWTGDMIAIHCSNLAYDDAVIRNRNGGRFVDVDIDRLSVHDSRGDVFDTVGSTGSVRRLSRGGNGGGLGECGGIEIGTDDADGEPYRPSVPPRNRVGINAFRRGL
jgi:hypothetical protein